MSEIDKIKEITALFLKTDANNITSDTIIDNTTIPGSIMVHRMYSVISKEINRNITDFGRIKTVGSLLAKLGLTQTNATVQDSIEAIYISQPKQPHQNKNISVGIDIEEISNLPDAEDYREHEFYKNNFTQTEISYCVLQQNPKLSFAGKFSAKEALVKADNSLRNIPFNNIDITNDDNGKPCFSGFSISISHSGNYAVAAAIAVPDLSYSNQETSVNIDRVTDNTHSQVKINGKIPVTALILSILTLLFVIINKLICKI